jgi:hypothetical protein
MNDFLANVATWQAVAAGTFVGALVYVGGVIADRVRLARWDRAMDERAECIANDVDGLTVEEIRQFLSGNDFTIPAPRKPEPDSDDA